MARILVTEEIAEGGLDRLRSAGHEVDVQLGLDAAGLRSAIVGTHALIIRSATDVTAEVLEAGADLVVVGRAGIGFGKRHLGAAPPPGGGGGGPASAWTTSTWPRPPGGA